MDSNEPFNENDVPRQRRLREWKIVSVRECPNPDSLSEISTPQRVMDYWNKNIATAPHYNPHVECLAVVLFNPRFKVIGHHLVSIGSLNETSAHPREIFRLAVASAAFGIIMMHNHPTGEPEPSEADKRVTRQMRQAGEILQIKLRDHVIIGHQRYFSFSEMGLL